MTDRIFTLSGGVTIETSIIGGALVTREEGPGYYSYKESAPMGPEYSPRRNGIKIYYWIILVPSEKLSQTIEWMTKQGLEAKGYGKYIKIDWNASTSREQEKIKQRIKKRLAEIYRPQ